MKNNKMIWIVVILVFIFMTYRGAPPEKKEGPNSLFLDYIGGTITLVEFIPLVNAWIDAFSEDFNYDGCVDSLDFYLLESHCNEVPTSPNWDASYDLSPDQVIDWYDYSLWRGHIGDGCIANECADETCGDGACNPGCGEMWNFCNAGGGVTCHLDCNPCFDLTCGNHICEPICSEDTATCPEDCESCYCGNSKCNSECGETDISCPIDCNNNYLILTPSIYLSTIQPLVDHRNLEYNVIVEITDGKTTSDVKNLIMQGAKYVLIVGDTTEVPSFESTIGSYPSGYVYYTDFPYSDLDNDDMPDIPVGRLANINKLELINKIIEYETTSYYNTQRIMLLAHGDIGGTKYASKFEQFTVPQFNGWGITKIYCNSTYDIGEGSTQAEIFDAMHNQQKIVMFRGHADGCLVTEGCQGTNLCSANAEAYFNNPGQYPIFIIFGCAAVKISPFTQFTKTLLDLDSRGGVAAIGRPAASGTFDMFQQDFSTTLSAEYTLGDALVQAKLNSGILNVNYLYQLMGDPALRLR